MAELIWGQTSLGRRAARAAVDSLGLGSEEGGAGSFGGVVRGHREAMWAEGSESRQVDGLRSGQGRCQRNEAASDGSGGHGRCCFLCPGRTWWRGLQGIWPLADTLSAPRFLNLPSPFLGPRGSAVQCLGSLWMLSTVSAFWSSS